MLRVDTDPGADAVYIELLAGERIHITEELDDNRLIDRTLEGKAVGVDLLAVSQGVKLEGLPEPDTIKRILVGLGVRAY